MADDDFDGPSGAEEAVRVFVRIRPLNKRELNEKQTISWNFNETAMLEDTPNGQRVYAYDACLGPDATNKETYEVVGKPVVLKAMEGYNGTVFTYGQTGSGKTWTMRGCESDPGMMILCVRDILDWLKNHPENSYSMKVAYMEVYNEEINDLLGDQGPNSKNLKIVAEDAARGAVIGGLIEEVATNSDDFMAILQRGESVRSYASTGMNDNSSRSHTIYRVTIEARDKNSGDSGVDDHSSPPTRVSYLNLVDLAGSERQKSTKAEGKVLKEGANINKSLLALAAVINKLGEASKKGKGAKPAFVPYRDSKLTRILKQSLGGNTTTSILCAVTPAAMHREETVSTLKFGQTCKSIKNNVKANDGILDDKGLIKQYRATIAELRAQVEELTAGGKSDLGSASAGIATSTNAIHLERKLKVFETVLMSRGVSTAEINAALQEAGIDGNDSSYSGGSDLAISNIGKEEMELMLSRHNVEINKLNDKISEQNKMINKLQRTLEEFQDLEESKNNLEEYEHNLKQELDDQRMKLEEEKHVLQLERHKLLKDRTNIDEKENKIGLLITNLDEKESKLRQMMATMKEQQEQWQRSITDLQRREDLVDDWQRNHKQREKKLIEIEQQQDKKYQEMSLREKKIVEEENLVTKQQRELTEREDKLKAIENKVNSQEALNKEKEDQLVVFENQMKKKVNDCDIRERELLSRRKELESWDALLREKDRKISLEEKNLDEREAAIKTLEERIKGMEKEHDKKSYELKTQETYLQENIEKYDKLNNDLIVKENSLIDREQECDALLQKLILREQESKKWEDRLNILQSQLRNIEEREQILRDNEEQFKMKEDEFYNKQVAQITIRHNKELKNFEEIIQKQLKIAADFQKELESTRAELTARLEENQLLQDTIAQRNEVIEELKDQLERAEVSNPVSSLLSATTAALANDTSHDAQATPTLEIFETTHTSPANNTNTPVTIPTNQTNTNTNTNNLLSPTKNTTNTTTTTTLPNNLNPAQIQPQVIAATAAGLGLNYDFVAQLALTREMIYQVLDKYDALPDSKSSPLVRKQNITRMKQQLQQLQQQQQQMQQQQQHPRHRREREHSSIHRDRDRDRDTSSVVNGNNNNNNDGENSRDDNSTHTNSNNGNARAPRLTKLFENVPENKDSNYNNNNNNNNNNNTTTNNNPSASNTNNNTQTTTVNMIKFSETVAWPSNNNNNPSNAGNNTNKTNSPLQQQQQSAGAQGRNLPPNATANRNYYVEEKEMFSPTNNNINSQSAAGNNIRFQAQVPGKYGSNTRILPTSPHYSANTSTAINGNNNTYSSPPPPPPTNNMSINTAAINNSGGLNKPRIYSPVGTNNMMKSPTNTNSILNSRFNQSNSNTPSKPTTITHKAVEGIYGKELSTIVSNVSVNKSGIPITTVDLNQHAKVKKIAENMNYTNNSSSPPNNSSAKKIFSL